MLLERHVVDDIIFAVGSETLPELEEVFLLCDEEGVRTHLAVDFFPHVHSTISLDRFGSTPLLSFSAAPSDEIRLLVKRAHRRRDRRGRAADFVAVHGCRSPCSSASLRPVRPSSARCVAG